MNRFDNTAGKGVGMLPALVLAIVFTLAGSLAQLSAHEPVGSFENRTAAQSDGRSFSTTTDKDGEPRTARVFDNQQIVIVESRDAKLVSWDSGKPKALLPVDSDKQWPVVFDEDTATSDPSVHAATSVALFDARAPPYGI